MIKISRSHSNVFFSSHGPIFGPAPLTCFGPDCDSISRDSTTFIKRSNGEDFNSKDLTLFQWILWFMLWPEIQKPFNISTRSLHSESFFTNKDYILFLNFQSKLSLHITRRMAIANWTCVSFCNQPKAHFGLPGYAPGTIAVNVTWMERGFNAGQTHSSIYLQPFTSYSGILVRNCNFFLPPLHLTPPLGCFHWNSGKKFSEN